MHPPLHAWSDAYIARHIAHRIMVCELGMPKKRLTRLQGYGHLLVMQSVRMADARMACPVFRRQYEKMAARAIDLVAEQLAEAA
jgi:hypothetical protein